MDVIISFEPQSVGTFQGNIIVESNDPETPLIVALRGRGIQPTGVENPPTSPPDQFVLHQNHPNPFNP